jgi:cell wall assembly regulator SMI1
MPTNWIPIAEPGPRVTDDDVRRFEREFGYELPTDYRAFLLEVNGGYAPGSHCVFSLRKDETILNSLFSLDATDDRDDLATAQKHYSPDAMLPEGVLEIGYDDGGGRIVLPLAGPHRGEVWYVDIENPRPTGSNPRVEWFDRRDVKRVAASFREFVDSLRPLDDIAGVNASP